MKLEMQDRAAVLRCLDDTHGIAGLQAVPFLKTGTEQVAINGNIFPVTDQDTYLPLALLEYLGHGSIEYTKCLSP